MKIRSVAFSLFLVLLAGVVQGADVRIDGWILPITQDTYYSPYNVIVGEYEDESGLMVLDNRLLTAWNAYVGATSGSSSNWVSLGDNSLLALDGTLYLGYDSSSNSLATGNGAVIYTGNGGVLGYYDGATNNLAVVDGPGTAWVSVGDISVGYGGASNALEVLDGAEVNVDGSLWVGVYDSATGNTMRVSGSSVVASNAVVVGYAGTGNRLQLLDGAALTSRDGLVGANTNADNNVVLVSGTGSVWTNTGALFIGSEGNSGNMVSVTNHGAVLVYEGLDIAGTNSFNLDKDGQLSVLSDFDASMDGFNFNEGGSLYVGGTLTGMTNMIDGGRSLGLVGGSALWDQSGSNVVVGESSTGNALHVEDGALVTAANLYVGSGDTASSNTVSVTGNGSVLDVAGDLSVGTASNAANLVAVADGGRIVLGGDLIIDGTDNGFNLGNGGWLVASNGLDASASGFNFLAGGTLESMGTLTGVDTIEDARSVRLTGSNAVWNIDTLYVGGTSSFNTLYLSDGAYVHSSNSIIGTVTNSGNVVTVTGAGSLWDETGSLMVNGMGNMLAIANGGQVSIGQNLSVRNHSVISFVSGGYASANSYYQDASSIFSFESVTNSPSSAAVLAVTDSAEFEGGATLQYTGTISGLERGVVFTNHLVDASTLIVDGVTNAATADLDALNLLGTGSLLSIDLLAENDDLIALISRMRLADSAGFADGTDMAAVSDEIDQLAENGNPRADKMINILSQLDPSRQHSQLSQLYDRHAPAYAHTRGMLDGFKQVRMRGVVPDPMLPAGAMGPHFYGEQTECWFKGYGSWGQRDGSGAFSGYDQSTYGGVLGADKSYGDILAGVAGGMATTDISQDDGDSSDATTGYGLFYASWGTLSWFGDLNLGYGHSKIEDRSGTMFNTTASYGADQFGFYLGGGKEMVTMDDHLFITPSASLESSYYMQESYVEKSSMALPRRVDSYDYLSMQSELGLKISYSRELERAALVPEVHANWLHEFNAGEEHIDYSLVGGTGHYSFGMNAPVEDLYEVGGGLSCWMNGRDQGINEVYIGLDGRFGDGYSETTASLRLLGQF